MSEKKARMGKKEGNNNKEEKIRQESNEKKQKTIMRNDDLWSLQHLVDFHTGKIMVIKDF